MSVVLQSVITCPLCGAESDQTMPENACLFFFTCDRCQARVKPKQGDCCVFCSYGTVACPPQQAETRGGEGDDDAHCC